MKKPESDWVWSEVPAIVSEELWQECNDLIDERRRTRKPPAKRAVQLFAGVTFCECEEKMYVPSNTPKYVCKACRNKVPIVDLEQVFHEQLRGFVFSCEELSAHLAAADHDLEEKQGLLAALEGERAKVEGEMEKTYRLYLDGEISSEGFGKLYRPLEERTRQLGAELPRLQADVDFLLIRHSSREEVIGGAQDLYDHWNDLLPGAKREIVETIVDRITVGKDEIAIDLRYLPPPPSPELMAKGVRNHTASGSGATRDEKGTTESSRGLWRAPG